MDSKPLSKEELLDAIRKMEQDPSNWARVLGEFGVAGLGAGGAGFAAATLGTSTVAIPIVTTLTGITMIAAAPVSLVAGAAVAGGVAAYGLAKLVTGSATQDGKRREILEALKQKLRALEQQERKEKSTDKDIRDFIVFLKGPLERNLISAEDAQSLMEQVTSGQLSIEEAYKLLYNIISDERRELLEALRQKLRALEQRECKEKSTDKDMHDFIIFLQGPLEGNLISAEDAQSLMEQVTSGQLSIEEAYRLLYNIISDEGDSPLVHQ